MRQFSQSLSSSSFFISSISFAGMRHLPPQESMLPSLPSPHTHTTANLKGYFNHHFDKGDHFGTQVISSQIKDIYFLPDGSFPEIPAQRNLRN